MLPSSALHYVVSREDYDVPPVAPVAQVEETVVTDSAVVPTPIVDPVPALNGDQPVETVIPVPVQEVVAPAAAPLVADAVVTPVDSPSASIPVATDTVISTEPAQPVDIQIVVDTQNPTAMLGQATQEAAFCQQQADDLLAMQMACEQYGKLLRQTGLEGISEEGAAFMQVGLKMIQRTLQTELVVSKESFDNINPRSSRLKVTISAESVKEMAGKAYDAFIAAIKKLISLIEKGWEQLQDFSLNQEKSIDDKLERLKKIKVNATSEEITVQHPTLLFRDGDELFPDVRGLFGLAHFAFKTYPNTLEAYFKSLTSYVRSVPKGDDAPSVEEINAYIDDLAKPLAKLGKSAQVEKRLNGNWELDVSGDSLSFGMREGDGKAAPESVELAVEAPVRLRKMLGEIKQVTDLLRDYRPANDRIVRAVEGFVKEAEKVEDKNVANKLLSVVKEAAPRNREIAHYIGKVTRAYLAVIDKMIAKHEAVQK